MFLSIMASPVAHLNLHFIPASVSAIVSKTTGLGFIPVPTGINYPN